MLAKIFLLPVWDRAQSALVSTEPGQCQVISHHWLFECSWCSSWQRNQFLCCPGPFQSTTMSSPTSASDLESQVHKGKEVVQIVELGEEEKKYEVDLEPNEHPQQHTSFKKWTVILVVATSALCVTCASSAVRSALHVQNHAYQRSWQASFTEAGIAAEFHVPHEVTILSITFFVAGLGIGPLLTGPLSEVYGRNIIYRVSYILLCAFTFGVAFAPDIGEFWLY